MGDVPVQTVLRQPYQAIQSLFLQHCQASGGLKQAVSDMRQFSVASELLKRVPPPMIPSLNDPAASIHELAGSIVRFRGMVQDELDSDLYVAAYPASGETGKYGYVPADHSASEEAASVSNPPLGSRSLLYCIPVPGESAWVHGGVEISPYAGTASPSPSPSPGVRASPLKRKMAAMMQDAEAGAGAEGTRAANVFKKPATPTARPPAPSSPGAGVGTGIVHTSFPLPGSTGLSFMIYVYDEDKLPRVNQVVDVIGILEMPSAETLELAPGTPLSEFPEEFAARNPPSSLVPRLHAIIVRPIIQAQVPVAQVAELAGEFPAIRNVLLASLAGIMANDMLAAEYTLLHLLSRVHRRAGLMPIGALPLNLMRWASPEQADALAPGLALGAASRASRDLAFLLRSVLPRVAYVPLTLMNLNMLEFVPKKDYTLNRLNSGVLQLSDGTEIVLDEAALQAGQLQAKGVANIDAVRQVIQHQNVSYHFGSATSTADFPCDLPVLVLSEGPSLFKVPLAVPIAADSSVADPAGLAETAVASIVNSDELLAKTRAYLGLGQRLAFDVPDDVSEAVINDFAAMRQADQSVTPDDFHVLMTMARLHTQSLGAAALSVDAWQHVKLMEVQRRARIAALSSSPTAQPEA